MTPNDRKRFWAKVNKMGPVHPVLRTRCWLWTAASRQGYGAFYLGGRVIDAHRVAYMMEGDEIPSGHLIDHRCHQPLCVRRSHLRAATNKENGENRAGHRSDNTSGVRGVTLFRNGKWRAQVVHNRSYVHVGYFDNLEDAERAVIAKRCELFTHNDQDRSVSA